MEHVVNAGVIGCNMSEDFFEISRFNKMEKLNWKKIFSSNTSICYLQKGYPEAEIVTSPDCIVDDAEISLVFISSSHLDFIPKVIQAGKSVRVVS